MAIQYNNLVKWKLDIENGKVFIQDYIRFAPRRTGMKITDGCRLSSDVEIKNLSDFAWASCDYPLKRFKNNK